MPPVQEERPAEPRRRIGPDVRLDVMEDRSPRIRHRV
jgi:hypothetical protein